MNKTLLLVTLKHLLGATVRWSWLLLQQYLAAGLARLSRTDAHNKDTWQVGDTPSRPTS